MWTPSLTASSPASPVRLLGVIPAVIPAGNLGLSLPLSLAVIPAGNLRFVFPRHPCPPPDPDRKLRASLRRSARWSAPGLPPGLLPMLPRSLRNLRHRCRASAPGTLVCGFRQVRPPTRTRHRRSTAPRTVFPGGPINGRPGRRPPRNRALRRMGQRGRMSRPRSSHADVRPLPASSNPLPYLRSTHPQRTQ